MNSLIYGFSFAFPLVFHYQRNISGPSGFWRHFPPQGGQLELDSLAWGVTLRWDEVGIPGLFSHGARSWQTFLQMRNKMISSFPPRGLTSLNLESTGGGRAALFCFPQAAFHAWPLSPSPALDTALKMGCCSLLWCPGASQPARKVLDVGK